MNGYVYVASTTGELGRIYCLALASPSCILSGRNGQLNHLRRCIYPGGRCSSVYLTSFSTRSSNIATKRGCAPLHGARNGSGRWQSIVRISSTCEDTLNQDEGDPTQHNRHYLANHFATIRTRQVWCCPVRRSDLSVSLHNKVTLTVHEARLCPTIPECKTHCSKAAIAGLSFLYLTTLRSITLNMLDIMNGPSRHNLFQWTFLFRGNPKFHLYSSGDLQFSAIMQSIWASMMYKRQQR